MELLPLASWIEFLEGLGVSMRLGIWVVFLLTAFYIWKSLKIGSRLGEWLVIFAFSMVVLGAGLALGIIEGIDVERFFGLVQLVFDFVWSIVTRIMDAV